MRQFIQRLFGIIASPPPPAEKPADTGKLADTEKPAGLNEFSKEVLDIVAAEFPDFLQWQVEDPENPDVLCLKIAAPNDQIASPLTIGTWDNEITILYDAYHQHLRAESLRQDIAEAITLANDFMTNKLLLGIFIKNHTWVGTTLISDIHQLSEASFYRPTPPCEIEIRSWDGSLDQRLNLDESL